MGIIATILGPRFLVSQIPLIAVILGGVLLALFSRYINEGLVFPIADFLRDRTGSKLHKAFRKKKANRYVSEAIGTIIFLLFCYFATSVVAQYVFIPLLTGAREFLILILLAIFFLISMAVNNDRFREKFM